MSKRRPHESPSLDNREQSQLRQAIRRLRAIPVRGAPSALFEALRTFVPAAGGMIGVMGPEMSGSAISHVVNLPRDVLEEWARTPPAHLHRIMAPLALARPGELISDRTAITGHFRERVGLLRVLDAAGLGESAGYKIGRRAARDGRAEHHFLTVALERRALITPRLRELLRLVQPEVRAALERMAVPLAAHEPILGQIIADGQIGYLCVSSSGALVQHNIRACELITRYLREAGIEPGRGYLAAFVGRALRAAQAGRPWMLYRPAARTAVEITRTVLVRDAHEVSEDMTLLMIRELDTAPPPSLPSSRERLTPRQMEVASLLISTSLQYREIAERIGVTQGTVRKHIEHVYAAYGVTSRQALTRQAM